MKIPKVKTKDLLTLTDLNKKEIIELFELAKKLKKNFHKGKINKCLKGKNLAMIFEKSSTRTRVSFEAGMNQLSGNGIFLSSDDIQIGRGETIEDTARVLSRYVHGIMIRTFSHEIATNLAKNASIPVINGLTDSFHPCQVLADYFTIYELEKDLSNVKLTYIGDGNNMANSLLLGAAILGINISVATPKNYKPELSVIEQTYQLSAQSGSIIEITTDMDVAVKNANYIYTDVWTSMGQEKESAKRKKAFAKYKITKDTINKCAPDCKIMHCLPAHRGEEIEADVIDSKNSIIFEEAENRLHVQKALLCILLNKK